MSASERAESNEFLEQLHSVIKTISVALKQQQEAIRDLELSQRTAFTGTITALDGVHSVVEAMKETLQIMGGKLIQQQDAIRDLREEIDRLDGRIDTLNTRTEGHHA